MCKIFPSNLVSTSMRCFDGLEKKSINGYNEQTRAFGARFVTCCRVPKPFYSLITISMKEGETLRVYSNHYQELYNEIGRSNRGVTTNTFKVGLPIDSKLRTSLTLQLVTEMQKLMRGMRSTRGQRTTNYKLSSSLRHLRQKERRQERITHLLRVRG